MCEEYSVCEVVCVRSIVCVRCVSVTTYLRTHGNVHPPVYRHYQTLP